MKCLLTRSPLLAAALALSTASLTAADRAWTGDAAGATDPNWSNGGNWNPAAAPAAGDNLVFSGFNQLANNNDLAALSLGWLRFDFGGYALAGNALTLSSGITNTLGNNSVGLALTLGAAQNFEAAMGSALTLTNAITLGANILSFTGDGNSTLGGVAAGAGYVVKDGSGTLFITAKPTFTGPFIINGGRVEVNTPTYERAFVNSTNIIVNAGATLGLNIVNILYQSGVYSTVTVNGGTVDLNGYHNHFGPLFLNGGTLNGTSPAGRYANSYTTFDFDVVVGGSAQSVMTGTDSTGNYDLVSTTRKFTVAATGSPGGTDLLANNPLVGGGLVKDGAGKMSLAAVNTYPGPTIISGGTLAVRDGGAILNSPTVTVSTNGIFDVSAVWIPYSVSTNQTLAGIGRVVGTVGDDNAGAAIAPGGNNAAGTLAVENLNLSGNLSFNFDLANSTTVGAGVNDLLIVTNLNLSTYLTNTVNFSFLQASPVVGGVYTLIKYTSCSAPAGIVNTLASAPTRFTFVFTNDTSASAIKVIVGGNPASLVWKGDGAGNLWDVVTSPNWLNGVTPDVYYQADNVTFNNTGSNNVPVNLTTTLTPTTVTVTGAKDYTFAGVGKLSGSSSLTKNSSGTLTVLTANDNTGAGTLSGGALLVGAGGTLGALGAGNLTNNSTVVFNRTDATTYPGNLTGSGKVTKAGIGTLNLTGTNSYTGGTLIANGTLQVGNNPPIPGASIAGPITNYSSLYFGRSDAFTLQGPITSAGNSFLNGPGNLLLRTTAGMTVDGTAGISLAGTMNVSQDVFGRLLVAPGGSVNIGGEVLIGNPASISGEIIQSGGAVNVTNRIRLAHWGTEVSYYTMNGGTLNVGNALNVGWDGVGLFTLNNGTVNCLSMAVDGNGNTGVMNGTNETFSITGGRINLGSGGITTGSTDGGYAVLLGGGTVGANATWASSLAMRLTNGPGVTFDPGPYTITLSGILSGTNGLTKTGAGYLNLNNATNSFSGPVAVAQGTLQGSGTVSGPVTVQPGAALSAGTTLAAGTLTVSNTATLQPGASLVVDASTTAATSDRIDVRGTLALDPAGTPVYFNFLGGRPFTGGAYTIVSNLVPRTGTISVVNPTRYAYVKDETDPNRIQVSFSGTNAALVWKGNVNNLWNVNGSANWLNAGAASTYYQSDAVIFDGTGLATPNVNLAAEVTPASLTVNANGDYAFSGAGIAGVTALVKSGTGKLTLANNNTFTGNATVGVGTLQIGSGGATGSLVANVVDNGALVFNRSDSLTYAGTISGSGTLTQAGAGTLVLTANHSYAGGTIINPGSTLQFGAGLGSGLPGPGLITIPATATMIVNRNDSPTIASPIAGAGNLTLIGPGLTGVASALGSYTLSASNTFSGLITLNQARLTPGNAFALGSVSSITVPPGSGVFASVAGAVFTSALNLSGSGWAETAGSGWLGALRLGAGTVWAGPITLSGDTRITPYTDGSDNRITGTITGPSYELELGTTGGTGLLTLAPSAPNNFGALRISPGTFVAGNANALPNNLPLTMNGGTLRLNGNNLNASSFTSPGNGVIQNFSTTTPATITLAVNSPITFGGTFADGSTQPLALVKTGPGTLNLSAINTALGGVTVNGGVLSLNNGGGNGTVKGTLTANPGTTILSLNNDSLGYNGGNNQVTNLVLSGASFIHTPNNNLTIWQNAVVNLNGAYFAATNTGGAARLDFGTGASLNTLASPVSSVIYTPGTAGTGTGVYLRQANTVFTVAEGAAADDLVINAPINQAAAGYGLTKNGPGRLKLNGPVGFTGPLAINAGSFVLGASSSLSGYTGAITLGAGTTFDTAAVGGVTLGSSQTLQGSGTLVGSVTDGFGSAIRPGNSAGTLTINGDLTLGGYGTLDFELANVTTVGGGVNDLIQVNGNVSLNDFSPTVVNFAFLNGTPTAGTYTLIKYTGTLSGTVAGLTAAAGYQATFTHVPASKEIRVTLSQPVASLVWEGDGGANTWDLSEFSTAWYNGSVNTNFYQANTVRFDDTRTTVNTTVNVGEAVKPAAITVDSAFDYTFSGVGNGRLSGAAGLTKNNLNTLNLAVTNEATGPILVNGGLLKVGAVGALSTGTAITIASGGAVDYAGFGAGGLRGYRYFIAGAGPDGNGAIQNSGAAIYENASVSNLTLTADATVGGVNRWDIGTAANQGGTFLQGGGFTLTKVGANEITVRPETLTNVAGLVINNGTLKHEAFSRTNVATATTTNTVNAGGVLGSYGNLILNFPAVFAGGSLDNLNSTATWTGPMKLAAQTQVTVNNPINLFGPISDAGGWTKVGAGALTISNANTYAGGTVISNGPVNVNGNGTSGTAALIAATPSALGTGPLNLNGGAITTDTATNTFRAVEFNVTAGGTVPNDIVLPTTLITNVSLQGRDATSVFTLAGKLSGGHAALTNWFDNGAGNVGVIRLSNPASDFVAGRIFLNRGTLALTSDGALGNAANLLNPAINSTVRIDASGVTLAHPLSFTANPTYLDLVGDNNGDGVPDTINNTTVSGIISGAGTLFVRGTNGVLTLTGPNTFTGGFELQQPVTLQAAASANLGPSAYVAVKANSTFRYTGTGSETMTRNIWDDSAALPGGTVDIPSATAVLTWNPVGGGVSQPFTKTGAGALTFASGAAVFTGGLVTANGGAFTINTVISGANTLVQVNTGTLTLGGVNTYSGATRVNGGTLVLNGSTAAGSAVTVFSGGTLSGNGTINGPATVQLGGVLSPGIGGIGRLTVANALTLGGSTVMEISKTAATNDVITSVSSLAYGGSLVVNNLAGTLAAGDTFKLFTAWGYFGSFASMTLPTLTAGLAWDTSGLLVDGSIKVVNVAPPALAGATVLPDGNFQLTLTGTVGQGYRILASSNVTAPLSTWTVLQSGTLPTATYQYTDLTATNYPYRFYVTSTP